MIQERQTAEAHVEQAAGGVGGAVNEHYRALGREGGRGGQPLVAKVEGDAGRVARDHQVFDRDRVDGLGACSL